jgi:transcriptional regulator with XRE-family HTH domain
MLDEMEVCKKYMELIQILSENIKTLCRASGLTLEEYAYEVGISKTTLQEITSGNGNPTLQTVENIAHYHDLSPVFMLSKHTKSEIEAMDLFLKNIRMLNHLTGSLRVELLRLPIDALQIFLSVEDSDNA